MTIPGLDCLGGADSDWNWPATARVWRTGFALGIFDGAETYGDAVRAIHTFAAELSKLGRDIQNEVPQIRIHAAWNKHGLIDVPPLIRRCQRYEALAHEYPKIRFLVSHTCEYGKRFSVADLQARIAVVKRYCPSCVAIQSPEGGARAVPGIPVEIHGDKARSGPSQIASTDGQNLFDLDAKHWINAQRGDIAFAWGMRFNLSESGPLITPPYKRTAAPDATYLQSLIALFDPIPPQPAPTFPCRVQPIVDPLCYKTHAEDMPGGNSRDNHGLLILKQNASAVKIVTFDGQPLGKFVKGKPPTDTFPGGRFRYYAGLGGMPYGWQIAEMAIQKSGNPWVFGVVGSNAYPFHPAFRCGFFHG